MKVINIFGGPAAGKSTTACGLFFLMKINNFKVELVTEYAKDLVHEGRTRTLSNQIYVFGKQNHRVERLRNQVEWAITDSPLILSSIYAPGDYPQSYHQMVLDFWNRYQNICIFMKRPQSYETYGRIHDQMQALEIDEKIKNYFVANKIKYFEVDANPNAPEVIIDLLPYNDHIN